MGLRDRLRRAQPMPLATVGGRGLTAAATRVDLTAETLNVARRRRAQAWQADAWVYRDAIGEVRYALDWLANIKSRLRLYVGIVVNPDEMPTPIDLATTPPVGEDGKPTGEDAAVTDITPQLVDDAIEALAFLAGGGVGHGHLLSPLTLNMEVPGECYLVGIYDDEAQTEEWSIRSMDELERNGDGSWVLKEEPGQTISTGKVLDPEASYVARLWNPHPRWHALPDSPMRGVLDPCETLLLATRKQRVRTRRRLSNGLLLVPDTMDFEPETGKPATSFMQRLVNLMVSAISDESSPASLAPSVIRGPKEDFDGLQFVDLSEKDAEDKDDEKVARALTRIGRGLDVPPEVIEGLKDVKFANAVAIDSTGFRYHIEPKAQRDVDALTQGYLWERLYALNHDPAQVRRLVIWYDPTEVVTNPNRLPDAKDLHERLVISDAVLRDAGGYSEADAPNEEELLRRLSAKTTVPEALQAALLSLLAAQAGIALPALPGPEGTPVDDTAPGDTEQPALPSGETQRPDAVAGSAAIEQRQPARFSALALALDLELRSRVTAAADAAMRRALERAGARVVSRVKRDSPYKVQISGVPVIAVTAAVGEAGLSELGVDVDELLAGAFDDLAVTFALWSTSTWEQGLRAACELIGQTYFPPDAVTAAVDPVPFSDAGEKLGGLDQIAMRNAWARDLAEAQQGLVADLAAEARRRLFSPTFTAPTHGEHDPTLLVQPGTVRKALATAGGANAGTAGGVDRNGRAVVDTDGDAGYVVTGHTMSSALTVAGVPQYGYRWVWGGSARPFPEHQALDGMTFADQSDDRLGVPDTFGTWLPGTSYFPGDHEGCNCSTERLVEDPFVGMDPAEERQVRAAQKARGADGRFVRTAVS